MKVWDRTRIELSTPGSAVRRVTDYLTDLVKVKCYYQWYIYISVEYLVLPVGSDFQWNISGTPVVLPVEISGIAVVSIGKPVV